MTITPGIFEIIAGRKPHTSSLSLTVNSVSSLS